MPAYTIKFLTYLLSAMALLSGLRAAAMAQEPVAAEDTPSIRAGGWLVVQFRSKIQVDFSGTYPQVDDKPPVLENRGLRFGADGTLFRKLDYSIHVDTRSADPRLRDAFMNFRPFRSFQIQAGRFKIPFGLDQLTDSGDLDFVRRSRIGTILAPGRDAGAMVQGELLEGKVSYAAGIFGHDGRNSRIEDLAAIDGSRPGGSQTIAAALTSQPAALFTNHAVFRKLTAGIALTRSRIPEGLSSLQGVTASGEIFFPRMYAAGIRLRRGAELSWDLKSLALRGEFMDVKEQRIGQGLRGEDLPDLHSQGWYVSAALPIAGSLDQQSSGAFIRSILPGASLGLFEATARYERIRFGSEPHSESRPSHSPRAAHVAGNQERLWTLGLNWHANPYVKFQFNTMVETLSDPARTPIEGEDRYWTQVGRFQLFF